MTEVIDTQNNEAKQFNSINNGLNDLMQAVYAVHCLVQAPLPLVFTSALSTLSIAAQNIYDVKCPGSGLSPISLNTLIVANSGERKTSTDRRFMKPIYDFEKSIQDNQKSNTLKSIKEYEIWKANIKKLRSNITKAVNDEDTEAVDIAAENLAKLNSSPPKIANAYRIVYEDTTIASFLQNLSSNWKSVVLSSSEGGIVFSRTSIDSLLCLNKIWDGESIRVDRISRPSFQIENCRVTTSLMTQQKVLEKFIGRGKYIARASGYLARFLVVNPESTQGFRTTHISQQDIESHEKYIKIFHDKIKNLLEKSYSHGENEKIILKFNSEATMLWRRFYEAVEKELSKSGFLNDIRDFGSKICNNVSRIAALIHSINSNQGDIDAKTVSFAIKVATEYAYEFKDLFGIKDSSYIDDLNAYKLHLKIIELYNDPRRKRITKSDCLRYSPIPNRDREDFEAAYNKLISTSKISVRKIDGITIVVPALTGFLNCQRPILPEEPIEKKRQSKWEEILGEYI